MGKQLALGSWHLVKCLRGRVCRKVLDFIYFVIARFESPARLPVAGVASAYESPEGVFIQQLQD